MVRSCPASQPHRVFLDGCVKSPRLGLLLAPLGGESGLLLLEGIAVVFRGLRRRCGRGLVGGRFELHLDPGGGGEEGVSGEK